MKIREGFVSNSSSTSFMVSGMSDEEIIRKLRLMLNTYNLLIGNGLVFDEVFGVWDGEIHNVKDNGIPFELFDLIEATFNTRRNCE